MIHHVSFGTNDAEKAKRFYVPVLELVGHEIQKASRSSVYLIIVLEGTKRLICSALFLRLNLNASFCGFSTTIQR